MKNWAASALIVGGIIAFNVSSAHAQAGGAKKGDAAAAFAKRDKNGDGFLTKDELGGKSPKKRAGKAVDRFAKLDKNKDGKLSKAEIKSVMKKRRKGA